MYVDADFEAFEDAGCESSPPPPFCWEQCCGSALTETKSEDRYCYVTKRRVAV